MGFWSLAWETLVCQKHFCARSAKTRKFSMSLFEFQIPKLEQKHVFEEAVISVNWEFKSLRICKFETVFGTHPVVATLLGENPACLLRFLSHALHLSSCLLQPIVPLCMHNFHCFFVFFVAASRSTATLVSSSASFAPSQFSFCQPKSRHGGALHLPPS